MAELREGVRADTGITAREADSAISKTNQLVFDPKIKNDIPAARVDSAPATFLIDARSFLGIDPGLSGAVAMVAMVAGSGGVPDWQVQVANTPTLNVGKKKEYDLPAMLNLLEQAHPSMAVLEKTHAMPKQGVTSMFRMGYGLGLWEGMLSALGIPYTLVAPPTWKREMMADMARDKEASRLRANQLFPQLADQLKTKNSHGRAEALLLAEYCRRVSVGRRS